MPRITLTEALGELKLLEKRIAKLGKEFSEGFSYPAKHIDPNHREGGSEQVLKAKWQSIRDLMARQEAIATAVRTANEVTPVTVGDVTKSIGQWLNWRAHLASHKNNVLRMCDRHMQQNSFATEDDDTGHKFPLGKEWLSNQAGDMLLIESVLDSRLSVINATTTIEVA